MSLLACAVVTGLVGSKLRSTDIHDGYSPSADLRRAISPLVNNNDGPQLRTYASSVHFLVGLLLTHFRQCHFFLNFLPVSSRRASHVFYFVIRNGLIAR